MSSAGVVMRGPWREDRLESPSLPSAAVAADYLGPARVVAVGPHEVQVSLNGRETPAKLALAFPYRPALGDMLLVIGKGSDHYVIGVLHGSGQTALTFPGGVEIRAEGGPLTLASNQAVRLGAPEVALEAETVRMTAGALVQKLTSVYQRVRALLSVHAGEQETLVEGASLARARSATIVTEESMSIHGKQIHLG